MINQISFKEQKPTLYIVSTPIGNLKDITYRAIEILSSVDYILAEDTRVTDKLLKHYFINKKLISYHEHNKFEKEELILKLLSENNHIALVSDAGTPMISDPGYEITQTVMQNEYPVVAIPGASALLTALITSNIAPMPFIFIGFLPRKQSDQKTFLEKYKSYQEALIIYESPKRIEKTLQVIYEVYGNRKISLARELTKKFETITNGYIEDILKTELNLLGEYVLIIEGNQIEVDYNEITIEAHVLLYIKQGYTEKEALKLVAKDRNVKKSDIYQAYKIK
ncbi:Ribosomal RNA small subunit methyltransferase I [Alteracholeplasma palmae J233]|uniref:Ribosomal RNA small subunit methyltransferase I n=1 Tax=Alteracholeplasma palmae (strain ATCC 49389 / J233) TaxID=1318466 RepID=U4KQN4_ALTPJ|nr:16S rRNA (cytidine(1402)-2'-O)-methyltransferase [Alteracholeplasma palmae]CCV64885.1 Ribosomal RNA small subunit methyltransferase I [Alteracholeplasma palmae J233]